MLFVIASKHLACLYWGLWVLPDAPSPLASCSLLWFLFGTIESWSQTFSETTARDERAHLERGILRVVLISRLLGVFGSVG